MKDFYDLHLHLDGSLSIATVRELMELEGRKSVESDEILLNRLCVSENCRDLNEYLMKFDFPVGLLQTKEALTLSVKNLRKELLEKDFEYAEIRFAPQLHVKNGLSQNEIVEAAVKGLEGDGVKAKLILCCMRGDENEKQNQETVETAGAWCGRGVCALDLAGAEALFPTENFKELFKRARDLEVPFTIHAGEADGPKSIYTALEFGARRIGHGVRAFEDKALVRELARGKIPLEMCPTSNLHTKVFEKIEDYPLMEYLNAGICATINSDNMTVSRTSVPSELALLKKTFSLSDSDIELIQKNSVIASF